MPFTNTRGALLQELANMIADGPFGTGECYLRFFTAGPSSLPPDPSTDFTYGAGQYGTAIAIDAWADPQWDFAGKAVTQGELKSHPAADVTDPVTFIGATINNSATVGSCKAYILFPQPITLLDPTDRIVFVPLLELGGNGMLFDMQFVG